KQEQNRGHVTGGALMNVRLFLDVVEALMVWIRNMGHPLLAEMAYEKTRTAARALCLEHGVLEHAILGAPPANKGANGCAVGPALQVLQGVVAEVTDEGFVLRCGRVAHDLAVPLDL